MALFKTCWDLSSASAASAWTRFRLNCAKRSACRVFIVIFFCGYELGSSAYLFVVLNGSTGFLRSHIRMRQLQFRWHLHRGGGLLRIAAHVDDRRERTQTILTRGLHGRGGLPFAEICRLLGLERSPSVCGKILRRENLQNVSVVPSLARVPSNKRG